MLGLLVNSIESTLREIYILQKQGIILTCFRKDFF